MALSQTQPPETGNESQIPLRELGGLDLLHEPKWRHIWRPEDESFGGCQVPAELPVGGFASPLGYWFHPSVASDGKLDALRVCVHDSSEYPSAATSRPKKRQERGELLPQTVSIVAPDGDELTLVVRPDGADVCASTRAWETLAEPVLLVVAEYARYASIERAFITLQNEARQDLHHAATAGLSTLRERGRLVERAHEVRTLISDWSYFAGPGSDPRRQCSSEESLEAYSMLSTDLEFDEWALSIDDVVEDVENTYEAVSDKLFHYGLFIWGMAVEAVIIALIVGLLIH